MIQRNTKIIITVCAAVLVLLAAMRSYVSIFKDVLGKQSYWGEVKCRTNESGNSYCRYRGNIDGVYLNKDGLALFFLNSSFSKNEASEKGFDITSVDAVALRPGNSDAQKLLYDMLNKANELQSDVEIHMRSVDSGYLSVDRVWLRPL